MCNFDIFLGNYEHIENKYCYLNHIGSLRYDNCKDCWYYNQCKLHKGNFDKMLKELQGVYD